MESFMLSETARYLYLLAANATDLPSFFVLSTEGHMLPPLPAAPGVNDNITRIIGGAGRAEALGGFWHVCVGLARAHGAGGSCALLEDGAASSRMYMAPDMAL